MISCFVLPRPLHMLFSMARREYPPDLAHFFLSFSSQPRCHSLWSRIGVITGHHVITGHPMCLFLEPLSYYIGIVWLSTYVLIRLEGLWGQALCLSNLQLYRQVQAQWQYKLPESTDYPNQASTLSIWHVNPIWLITKWLVDLMINMFSNIKKKA